MKRELRAIAAEPLHLADRHGAGNYSGTLDYIPGTALRGAFAMAYLRQTDRQQQVAQRLQATGWSFADYFHWVFLSDLVRFPNLYPRQESQTFVIPRSARSCKRFHGFVDEDRPVAVRGHGVFDTLLYAPEDFRCTKRQGRQACGAPMEPIYGFYASESGAVSGAQQVQPARRSLTRTAIEYATDTARSGRLYTLEAMEEGGWGLPFFAGIVEATPPTTLASETHKDIVLHLLWEHLTSEAYTLTVGTAKTRGLGKIRLEFPAFASAILPSLEERFDHLQRIWRQVRPPNAAQTVFTLTLNADAIILDELWRFRSVLDDSLLAREVPGSLPCRLEVRCFTDTRIISGWNSAHGLPKEPVSTPGWRRRIVRWRACYVTVWGWLVAMTQGLVILHIAGKPIAHASWGETCLLTGVAVLGGEIHFSVLFLFAPCAMLIGVIVQIFWEEKSVTHPV